MVNPPSTHLFVTRNFLSDIHIFIRTVLKMSEESVIGRRYTLVIPKAVREELALKEGQRVLIRIENNRIIIEPLPWDPYQVLEKIVGEPYEEEKDEAKAERWLRSHAGC
jgi:AbrB family looped-hinge helix DNA binding protein